MSFAALPAFISGVEGGRGEARTEAVLTPSQGKGGGKGGSGEIVNLGVAFDRSASGSQWVFVFCFYFLLNTK